MKRKQAANEQLQQMRANARKQVADVKQQIEQIQQQSLVNMQHFVNNLYKESNAANIQQLTDAMNATRNGLNQNTAGASTAAAPDPVRVTDPGQEAMSITEKYVQQAIESAGEALKKSEGILGGLYKKGAVKP